LEILRFAFSSKGGVGPEEAGKIQGHPLKSRPKFCPCIFHAEKILKKIPASFLSRGLCPSTPR
jgi:hypothetical protein